MPRKIPGPKINPQKIPCRIFRALKITKHYIVNDITQKIKTVERDKKKKPLQNYVAGKRRHYHEFSDFLNSPSLPPPTPPKNKQTNKQTKTFLPPT